MTFRFLPSSALGVMLATAACSSSSDPSAVPTDTGVAETSGDAIVDGGGASLLEIACGDDATSTFAAPATITGAKGTILRCARDLSIDKDKMLVAAQADGYVGKAFVSGAHLYRLTFVTERATEPPTPGFSSAILWLPDNPVSKTLPVIVAAHGTGGQGGKCAPSQEAAGLEMGGMAYLARPIVGAGFAVIVPDYAGFAGYGATGNPPSGYAFSADIGRSTLDAARALKLAIPSHVGNQVVIVGHSQGGHTALSALAMAATYASDLDIVAAVAYAPLWFSNLSWGAMLAVADLFPMSTSSFAIATGAWYHYSHGEIEDGAGHGGDIFAADKRAAIKEWFDGHCSDDDFFKGLGAKSTDLYDPAYTAALGNHAIDGSDCTGDGTAKALCDRWMARYKGDRPHLTGKAAAVPLLVLYGDADTTIPADRMACGFERLKSDKSNVTFCIETGADHHGVVEKRGSYVADWIAARTLGAAEPAKCARDETTLVGTDGKIIECATPPVNDKD